MIIEVRYACFTDGTANVVIPVDPIGGMDNRTLNENDVVASIQSNVPNTTAVTFELLRLENGVLVPNNPQPSQGDLIVVTCPASDVSYLAGQVGVVASDGTLAGASMGALMWIAMNMQPETTDLTPLWEAIGNSAQNLQWLNDQVNELNSFRQSSVTNSITPMAADSPVNLVAGDGIVCISADTSEGDVIVNLPPAYPNRPAILITNRNGSGVVQIVAQEPIHPSGGTTLILGPVDRVTLQSFGGGWERV
jgi:hypothetical protein